MRQDDKDRGKRERERTIGLLRPDGGKEAVKKGTACYFSMTEHAQQRVLAWGLTAVCPRVLTSEQAFVV